MDLVEQMKVVLATTFGFYLKSHFFHWNVEGTNFPEYHKFFQKIYEDAFDAIDGIAEHIRTLDAYAPGSFERLKQLSKIQDELNIPPAMSMITKLMSDNDIVIDELKAAEKLATEQNMVGLANFLQDRVDMHAKWGWQLKATAKV
jgi:starvation-inducible DNA-binding protein